MTHGGLYKITKTMEYCDDEGVDLVKCKGQWSTVTTKRRNSKITKRQEYFDKTWIYKIQEDKSTSTRRGFVK